MSPHTPARRYLVTGGRGFIGRHLLARLAAQGAEVHATTRSATPPADPARALVAGRPRRRRRHRGARHPPPARRRRPPRGPRRRHPTPRRRRADPHRHPAHARSRSSPRRPGCRGARSSLAGSVEDGGHQPDVHSPYAASKAAAATYATLFHGLWQLDVTVLRLAMVYGPDDPNAHRLIPSVVAAFADGRRPAVSSGTRRIDWVYVDDVVDAFLAAADGRGRRRLRHRLGHARVDPRHRAAGRGRHGHRDRARVRRGGRPAAGAGAARRPEGRPARAWAGGPGWAWPRASPAPSPLIPAAGRLLVSESEGRGWAAETGGAVATRDTRRGRARAPGRPA